MSKSFLITSHTEGRYAFEQRTILNGLVSSLRKYFPDCFIVVASQSSVPDEVQKIVDYVFIDKKTVNVPHGNGELNLVKSGVEIMQKFNRPDFYKITYDFIIDNTNYMVFDQWASHGKSFVTCGWEIKGSGLGTWAWYGNTETIKKIFDFEYLNTYIECKVLESVQQKNLIDQCYIYRDHEDLFNGDWFSRCDLVHEGGNRLQYEYGSVIAVAELNDNNNPVFLSRLYSILNQTKDPDHLLIIDRRTDITDLREKPYYKKIFQLFSDNSVSWSVLFGADHNQLLVHLANLGYTWCWLVGEEDFLPRNILEIFYEQIIFDRDLNLISVTEENVFYKNAVVVPGPNNNNLSKYVVTQILESGLKNMKVD